ncbi:MAG: DUF424 family protein [Candidatus Aenigmarchaeota archaeon]|nr:DUF424 family protein [Candidatus Aenigmarchaeota archaeon]
MFWGKFFVVTDDLLLAMCDDDLLDKRIKDKKLGIELTVSKYFYGEKLIDNEKDAVKYLNTCSIGNIIGTRIVALAKKSGFITKENVISIGGVPHAQFVKLKYQ